MTLKITPEPVRSFLTYKQVIQNCSKLTCEKYEHDLSLFFRFIISKSENRPFDDVDPLELEKIDMDRVASIRSEDIYAFLLFLANERDNGDSARARRAIKGGAIVGLRLGVALNDHVPDSRL